MKIEITSKHVADSIAFRRDKNRLPELAILYTEGYLCPAARAASVAFNRPVGINKAADGSWFAFFMDGAVVRISMLPPEAQHWIHAFENFKRRNPKPLPLSFDLPALNQWRLC